MREYYLKVDGAVMLRLAVLLSLIPIFVNAQSSPVTCTDWNNYYYKANVDFCVTRTCDNSNFACTGVSVGSHPTQPGTWFTQHFSVCPNAGEGETDYNAPTGQLSNCSTNEGRSTGKKLFSSVVSPKYTCGSIIRTEEQALGERINIVGAKFDLMYTSKYTLGTNKYYKGSLRLTDNTVDPNIHNFGVGIKRAGLPTLSYNFVNNLANRVVDFTWDGTDFTGNQVQGYNKFEIEVLEQLTDYDFKIESVVVLGGFRSKLLGLGGWVPSIYKFYDIENKKMGDSLGEVIDIGSGTFAAGQVYVPSIDGSEVYIFDATNGRHLYTKTGLLGTTIYTFNYDTNGALISIAEPFGLVTTFDRNSSGKLISITAPKGQVSSVTLDTNDYLVSIQDPNSGTHVMTYSSDGLLQSFAKPGSQSSTFTYDGSGSLTLDSHSGGYFFDLVNSVSGSSSMTTMTSGMGRIESVQSYPTETGNGRNSTDTRGVSSYYSYDRSGTTISESYSRGSLMGSNTSVSDPRFGNMAFYNTYNYIWTPAFARQTTTARSSTLSTPGDPFSISSWSQTSQVSGTNISTTTSFNPTNKTFSTSTYLGKTMEVGIDNYERAISIQQGNLNVIGFGYTGADLTSVTQGTRVTNLTYNSSSGFLETVVNPLLQSTMFVRDSVGNIVSKILPDSRVIGFSYDLNGKVTSITPPSRPAHYFSFNNSENVSAYTPPSLSGVATVATSYAYNADKQLTQVTRPDGSVINFTYSVGYSYLEGYTTPDGTFSVGFDANSGGPSSIFKPDGSMMYFSYNGPSITGYSRSGPGTPTESYSKTLNSTGNVDSDTVSSEVGTASSISYSYNDDEDLSVAGSLNLNYSVPNGLLFGTALGSGSTGITDSYTYNTYGEVTGYTASRGTTVLYTLALTRDGVGRIAGKTQTMNSVSNAFDYVFDSAGRLTQVSKNSVVVSNYGYDGNSNRNSGNVGAQSTSATYDDQDRLSTYNTLSFTYNANGDLQTKTNATTSTTTTYVYDVFGNLTSVTLPTGTVITYEIDALNRRVAKSVNGVLQKRWIYMDQYRIAAELNATGTITKRFIYGSKGNIPDYMVASGITYRIISDHLGSPRLVVRQSNGAIQQRMDHDEFGRVNEDTNPGYLPFGFAGGLYDHQTGIVRFGARDFDSEIGRWTGKDPILFNGRQVNLYGYTYSDPVNFIDPTGNVGFLGGIIGAGIGGVSGYLAGLKLKKDPVQMAMVGAGIGAASGFSGAFLVHGAVVLEAGIGGQLVAGIAGYFQGGFVASLIAQQLTTGKPSVGEAVQTGLFCAVSGASGAALGSGYSSGAKIAIDGLSGLSLVPVEVLFAK